jgi:homoprotocatechuate degradation regulator HpaR
MPTQFSRPNLPTLLLRARESVLRYFRADLRRHGLTDQKWRVLRALEAHETLEIGQIAEQCVIVGPSLTGVLERMERDHLVLRVRSAIDQRRVLVTLQPAGRRLVERLKDGIEARYALIEQHVGDASLDRLFDVLTALARLPEPELRLEPEPLLEPDRRLEPDRLPPADPGRDAGRHDA